MNKLIVSILLVSAVLFACKGTQKAHSIQQSSEIQKQEKSANQLFGTKWKLINLNGTPIQASETLNPPWIQIDSIENRINGSGGCNRFFGKLSLKGTEIEISNVGSTKMACPNLEIESAFFQMLENSQKFAFKQTNQLEFYDTNNQPIGIFEAIPISDKLE